MRRLIMRFRNEKDLLDLFNELGIEANEDLQNIKSIYIEKDDNKIVYKKQKNKKTLSEPYWKSQWYDMPNFELGSKDEYVRIDFYFEAECDLSDILKQKITDKTKSIWFPKLTHGLNRCYRFVGGENPKYPIYVVSKGRYDLGRMSTSFRLSEMNTPHFLVVEPDEYDQYKNNFKNKYCEVIKMDMKFKEDYDCFCDLGNVESTGPGAVRNFCWEDSIKRGFDYHWVMDDNLDGFHRFWNGKRILMRTGVMFNIVEKFAERYENLAITGLNYSNFCRDGESRPAFVLNTRIYSCLLIKNNIDYRWRGRYNEDTDLSLRILKDGLCTVQFNLFLSGKRCTQQIKGGNTAEFYESEGTYNKSKMLELMHPDVVDVVNRFNRIHHYVDYSIFKQKLESKECIDSSKGDNEHGIKLIKLPSKDIKEEFDTREALERLI